MEILGSYDPHQKTAVLKEERIKYWLSQGVQASDSVHNLLVSKGVISDKKRVVKIPKKEELKAEETKPEEKAEKTEEKPEEPKQESASTKAMADKELKSE